ETCLRFEARHYGTFPGRPGLLDINEGRHPTASLYVDPPTVEMEVNTRRGAVGVCPVQTHDLEIPILHPDSSFELSRGFRVARRHIEHQASHLAQKLLAHEVELIVPAIETVRIGNHHL